MRKVVYILADGTKMTDYQRVLMTGQRYKVTVEPVVESYKGRSAESMALLRNAIRKRAEEKKRVGE